MHYIDLFFTVLCGRLKRGSSPADNQPVEGCPHCQAPAVDIGAPGVAVKNLLCVFHIAVDLPVANILEPVKRITNEASYVLRGISQKKSDLMRKLPGTGEQ